MDRILIGPAIFLLKEVNRADTHMPTSKGIRRMETILMISDIKSISSDFNSPDNDGISDTQKIKFSGVIINAASDENAVSVTDKATWPRAM